MRVVLSFAILAVLGCNGNKTTTCEFTEQGAYLCTTGVTVNQCLYDLDGQPSVGPGNSGEDSSGGQCEQYGYLAVCDAEQGVYGAS
jgi:hypothetical protein